MSVTQREIAERLNMSQAHVARALSGKKVVSEKTRLRVEATAREMGYDPYANTGALAMNARRHGKPMRRQVIAIVFSLQDHLTASSLRNSPHFVPVLNGMEDEAADLGCDICLCPAGRGEVPRLIREKSVDGMIMMVDARAMQDIELPRVTFHWNPDQAYSVGPDDTDGARQATRHLLELGHRRIAFLSFRYTAGLPWERRLNGYLDAMREFGAPVREEWIETDLAWPNCTPTASDPGCGHCACCIGWAKLVAKNRGKNKKSLPDFTAVVCYNDLIAMGAVVQARKEGVIVPRDLSVVGFDDVSLQYQFQPALTSVSMPGYEMGRQAIRLLQERIEAGTEHSKRRSFVAPVSLVVRDSTEPPHR